MPCIFGTNEADTRKQIQRHQLSYIRCGFVLFADFTQGCRQVLHTAQFGMKCQGGFQHVMISADRTAVQGGFAIPDITTVPAALSLVLQMSLADAVDGSYDKCDIQFLALLQEKTAAAESEQESAALREVADEVNNAMQRRMSSATAKLQTILSAGNPFAIEASPARVSPMPASSYEELQYCIRENLYVKTAGETLHVHLETKSRLCVKFEHPWTALRSRIITVYNL